MSRKSFIIKAAVISAIVISLPFICCETLSEVRYSISSDKISAPVKLAFISDLHNTRYGKNMSELIGSIDRFSPDVVILGGDLFDMYWGEENSLLFAKTLAAKYPCCYALGNHEFKYYDNERIKSGAAEIGLTVLDGKYKDITASNGGKVRIIGIDGAGWKEQLRSAKDAVSDDIASVLVDHYPEEFPELNSLGFDIILSGHAHGGQWRFPPFINGVYSPGEGLFPKYAGGLYEENGCKMIVSRGLQRCCRDIIAPRVFNRPEVVFITIDK